MLPEHLALDAHGTIGWRSYRESGQQVTEWIARELRQLNRSNPQTVREWDCGPGRVIRQIPTMFMQSQLFGSDYNVESIDWCRGHVAGVSFVENSLNPCTF